MTSHLRTPTDDARCKGCGYWLRNITATRCPECGREFDPADPRTVHHGTPAGFIGRFLLRPASAVPIALACVAAIALLCISRLTISRPQASWVELKYYFHHGFRDRLVTFTDLIFFGAVCLLILVLAYLLLRSIARWLASRHYHRKPDRPVHLGRRAMLLSLATLTSAMAIAFGWPYRIAKIWIRMWSDQLKAQSTSPWFSARLSPVPPTALSPTELDTVLQSAVIQLPTVSQRTTALHLLMSEYQSEALPILLRAIKLETDVNLRAMEIGLIGLFRDPKNVPDLLPLLDHPDPQTRAAAIDAIGIIYWPAFPIPNVLYTSFIQPKLATDPAVPLPRSDGLNTYDRQRHVYDAERSTVGKPADALLDRLRQLAFDGPTTLDREAAGRAVFKWQAKPKFRVAEWGVWIAGTTGNFQLSKSVLEEIPPFAHQTGDRVENDSSYLTMPDSITKPIIHITTEQPLVLDVGVLINGGRPWYVYPLPDDYTVSSGPGSPEFSKTVSSSQAKLPEPHRGYKWISPPHDTAPDYAGWGQMFIESIGVRWQTLLVHPARMEWMLPPTVPADARYAWWSRLREVPSAWVSSRGESERFLYYDGPTTCVSTWSSSIESDRLIFKYNQESDRFGHGNYQFESAEPENSNENIDQGLFIALDRSNRLTGETVTIGTWPADPRLQSSIRELNSLQGPAVPAKLLELLTDAGLTVDEAHGLIDSWRPQFFQTPGRRFIRVMSPKEYNCICPIQINPPPSKLVRVGLVLNEFGEG